MSDSAHIRRLLLLFSALVVMTAVSLSATSTHAQSADPAPPAGALLPDEDDGSDTDNEDPDVAPAAPGSAALAPQAGVLAPCPLLSAPDQPSPGGCPPCDPRVASPFCRPCIDPRYPAATVPVPPRCLPCPVPLPATGAAPNVAAPAVLPPPPYDCIQPSVRAIRAGVNLANQVQAQSLRTLEAGVLRRAFVEPALGEMAGFVDTLLWSGRYADARLLGVRHLDTAVGGRTATTRTIERWDYREYDLDSGRLLYTSYQTVENRWRLMKVGTRWLVSGVEIIPR